MGSIRKWNLVMAFWIQLDLSVVSIKGYDCVVEQNVNSIADSILKLKIFWLSKESCVCIVPSPKEFA